MGAQYKTGGCAWIVYPPTARGTTININEENGMVTALAAGTATITVRSLEDPDIYDEVGVTVTVNEMESVNFTWDFLATPAIPGWTATASTAPNDAASLRNIVDVVFENNMLLLPSRIENLRATPGTVNDNTGGGISWAPNDARPVLPGGAANTGWIQMHGETIEGHHPIVIANVQAPFTLRIGVASTGGNVGEDQHRRAIVFVDDEPIPAVDGVTLPASGIVDTPEWLHGLPAGPAATNQNVLTMGEWVL